MQIWPVILTLLTLAACSGDRTDFPIKAKQPRGEIQHQLGADVTVVPLTADNIGQFAAEAGQPRRRTNPPPATGWSYRVGAGDLLNVMVWDHPELSVPAGEGEDTAKAGLQVQSGGTFFYPYVGQVDAVGLTAEAIRANLTLKLAEFIPNPQVQVRVVGFNSQSISVTGEVAAPNRQSLTEVPLTLLQAVDAAGGLTEDSDPRAVTIQRRGVVHTVDLAAFLQDGVAANNPTLLQGDVVNVPRSGMSEAFVLGQVGTPAPIDLSAGNVSLTQALSQAGGLNERSANARGVFVFRQTPTGITVYQLDTSTPVGFVLGTRFALKPQDVIYVTTSPLSKWNEVISNLLPSISVVATTGNLAG